MEPRALKWYKIVGYPTSNHIIDVNTPFIRFIESASPHNVLKYHGGKRRCEIATGKVATIQFPTQGKDVQLLSHWNPEQVSDRVDINPYAIVKVIPVTKYRCECGQERVSEHPYPSMWCSCGKKAFPIYGGQKSSGFPFQSGNYPVNPYQPENQI